MLSPHVESKKGMIIWWRVKFGLSSRNISVGQPVVLSGQMLGRLLCCDSQLDIMFENWDFSMLVTDPKISNDMFISNWKRPVAQMIPLLFACPPVAEFSLNVCLAQITCGKLCVFKNLEVCSFWIRSTTMFTAFYKHWWR